MAQVEHVGDIHHRHVFPIRLPDRLIAFFAEPLGGSFQLALFLAIRRGEGFQPQPGADRPRD